MTLSAIAGPMGVARSTVLRWGRRGCPLDSLEAVQSWVARNVAPGNRPRGVRPVFKLPRGNLNTPATSSARPYEVPAPGPNGSNGSKTPKTPGEGGAPHAGVRR